MFNGHAKSKPGSSGILLPALRYNGDCKAIRETFVDEWLRTGDQIRIDEDDVLLFEDRSKDTLKVSGMQVAPVEIENTLLAQQDKLITDVTVAGVSGGRTSDERILRAWVVLSSAGAALGEKEVVARLDAWVQERLSRYKWLRGGIGIVAAANIPKSPTGKVLRRVFVEEYEKQELTGIGGRVPESNIHHLLFNRPDQKEWPDYTAFVDVATGQRRSFWEFVERVRDGATALGADVAQGGLGIRPENGEVVGILSENCMDYISLIHSLLIITVPFALFSSYSTPYEFNTANLLVQPTRIFASPSLLPLALTSGLPADRIYLLEGENEGYTSYDQLVSSVRKNAGQAVFRKACISLSGLRFPYHRKMDAPSTQHFSLRCTVVMASHGNIAYANVIRTEYGKEVGKVQGVSLRSATFFVSLMPLLATGMEYP
ncbi:acetyl-CoA synthetase-like protein [Rhizopogon vinicolor AM-OR11-026]|uniref:Acetyl-CoA synthetase-like protein n=1 Tax=Rhizopogon vinicolor AM-OR11-026 TaxID=1314800 RepID=A0A1B7MGA7_9AGAM|nr:acetyl-CoA synthetase-like protein [Rhizopogon vinicolor AM-OR11-026]